MNIASLRTVLKSKWLTYYRDNRHWITRLRVWGTYEERRRPSSSFILGALSAQEPELMQLLPLVVDLNNNPDRIVAALGLDFNPEDELEAFEQLVKAAAPLPKQALKMLSNQNPQPINLVRQPVSQPINSPISQPINSPINSPISQPINSLISQPINSPVGQPAVGNARIPLDTAQLSIHEQPDRDTGSPATQNERSRDAEPLP